MTTKTPDNPSKSATARVKHPLPVPHFCNHCNGLVDCVRNSEIYGGDFGEWPYAYLCRNADCGAYVGLHPFTNIPLGYLANAAEREARKRAKASFTTRWRERQMTRTQAYAELARMLNLPSSEAHIAMLNVEQCEKVVERYLTE